MHKFFISLALLLTTLSCFASEEVPEITLEEACMLLEVDPSTIHKIPLDGQTHIIMLHDDEMKELQHAAKVAVEEVMRHRALEEAAANLQTAIENGESGTAQMRQLHDLILSQLTETERAAVEQDMIQIRRMLLTERLLEDGPLWMRKGRQLEKRIDLQLLK